MWTLLGVNVLNITSMLKGADGFRAFSNLKQVISGIINSKKNTHKKNYVIGMIFTGVVFIIGNAALSAITSLTFIVSLLKGRNSKLINILSLFKSKRAEKKIVGGEIINRLTCAVNGSTLSILIFTILGSSNFGKGMYPVILVLVMVFVLIFGKK